MKEMKMGGEPATTTKRVPNESNPSSRTKKNPVQMISAAACLATVASAAASHGGNNMDSRQHHHHHHQHVYMGSSGSNSGSSLATTPTTTTTTPAFNMVNELRGGDSNNHGHHEYYHVLGVSRTATSVEIKKAYRRRAIQTHPDKTNGDRTEFDKVSEAYAVLNDDTKKALYDRFGKRGLEPGGPGGGGGGGFSSSFQSDILRNLFGMDGTGGHPFQRQQQQQQQQQRRHYTQTVRYQLEVTLEELYSGVTKDVTVSVPGRSSSSSNRSRTTKRLRVTIPPGARPGQRITLPGEMDHARDATPGDAVFILAPRKHATFSRKHADLAMECRVSLREALCGLVDRPVTLLDGTTIRMNTAKIDGVQLRTGDVHVLTGRGLPIMGNSGNSQQRYGDLYVQFKVIMPGEEDRTRTTTRQQQQQQAKSVSRLTPQETEELGRLLDKLEGTTTTPAETTTTSDNDDDKTKQRLVLRPAKASDFGRNSNVYEEEPDDEGYLHEEDDDEAAAAHHQHPFFRSSSRQFFSFPPGAGRGFSSGSSSFGGGGGGGDDSAYGGNDSNDGAENVQCQQM